MAHNNFYNLAVLLKMLDNEYNDIFLHVDKKISNFSAGKLDCRMKYAGLHIFQEFRVNWGGFSQIRCELFLLKKACEYGRHSFYHLLSSADLPVKSHEDIRNFFEKHPDQQFIQFDEEKLERYQKNIYYRLKYYQPIQELRKISSNQKISRVLTFLSKVIVFLQMILRIDRLKDRSLQIAYGSQWFSINQSFAEYIIKNEKWIRDIFEYTQVPDELFIQMLAINSPFKNTVFPGEDHLNGNLREIIWDFEYSREHPHIFTMADWEMLKESKALFARKFSDKDDRMIIKKIEREFGYEHEEQNSGCSCDI